MKIIISCSPTPGLVCDRLNINILLTRLHVTQQNVEPDDVLPEHLPAAVKPRRRPHTDLFEASSPGRCLRRYDDPIHHASCEHILSAVLIPPAH